MSVKAERRTIEEQIGRAVNSNSLRTDGRSPEMETSLLQVAALGAAGLHVHHGANRGGQALAEIVAQPGHAPDPQDVLAADLASELWHIRYGRQNFRIPRAARLFCDWLAYRGRFNGIAPNERPRLLYNLATIALHEWLSDRCTRCGGTGRLEVTGDGTLVRGRGLQSRNAVFRGCPVTGGCGGTGRSSPSHTARRVALGITRERYDAERWDAHCKAALSWLGMRISPLLRRPLTAQLERCIKRD